MNKKIGCLVAVLMLGLSLQAFAEEGVSTTTTTTVTTTQALPPGMDAAMMQKMMLLTSPNENHKALEPMVGTWKHTSTFWMSPTGAPEVSQGTSTARWIMDGRFVQQNFQGQAMGKPFEGMAITGYDNIKGEYSSIWIDNMSTGMMVASAQYNPATKTFNEQGTMSCPMTGEKDRPMRSVIKWIDNDHYTHEMYMTDLASGKEYKGMEIVYERVK